MATSIKGVACGVLAAACCGTNPLGALPLYEDGVNTSSVLVYRFTAATAILALVMMAKRISFKVTKRELGALAMLGVLFGVSSILFYQSFHYVDAGIASTILFVYPVIVALMMSVFFHEKVTMVTVASIAMALTGIALMYKGDAGATLNGTGVMFVMTSAVAYASYIIALNQSKIQMSSLKLTFYSIFFCLVTLLIYSITSPDLHLMAPPTTRSWLCGLWLGLVPSVLSLVFMAVAVHEIGATPTAVMGAVEPLTAVAIGVTVFGEAITGRIVVGIALILVAVTLIVMGKNFHVRTLRNKLSRFWKRRWTWK